MFLLAHNGSRTTTFLTALKALFSPGSIVATLLRLVNVFGKMRFTGSGPLKAGFHWRRSRSRSRNQKPRAIRSSENQTDGVGSRTLIPLMTPSLTIS